jgi:hypothetical protein
MGSSDTYHPKTVWMAQGATHLRCSSGGEIAIAAGGKFRNYHATTGAKASTTLNPYGNYALDTSGVYIINPEVGSVCTVHVHSTAFLFFKATSGTYNSRFPTSKMRCLKVAASSKDSQRWGPAFQIKGFSSDRAYVAVLSGTSNSAGSTINTRLIVIETSST